MLDAPRQNWAEYNRRTRPAEAAWQRQLTANQKFALYSDMFRIVMGARKGPGDWKRLEEWRWREKLARRQREVAAYQKLDQWRRERSASHDSR